MGLLRICVVPWALSEIWSSREGISFSMLNVGSKQDLVVVISDKRQPSGLPPDLVYD